MGLFSGIENAKLRAGGNYMEEGTHHLRVIRLITDKTRAGEPFMAADFEVLGSTADHKVGSIVNWFNGATGKSADSFLPNAKALAIAVLSAKSGEEVAHSDVNAEVMEAMVGPWEDDTGKAQAPGTMFAGVELRALAVKAWNKEKTKQYTRINWSAA